MSRSERRFIQVKVSRDTPIYRSDLGKIELRLFALRQI